ncbi:MAG: hypothetical protein UT77_C0005G0037 [Candidatus Daviesbacteria bacterium GW2011_GWC2_40_12]|uniref:Cyanophycin synthase-like N-terminal domain-containing protein n=1 Tax=Candidatus Daviesbacteria bacterium GW2011_GWC2_40_12 TaxID=1618431 RepID=A0A0G0TVH9_9BACT|nr:MAG: hypothetical protein UT45_C0008G0018 [Candidatus Daviesbacteria bacterium GW2011_GWA2_39_33]KKR41922.1 MAG: hypothetical protein UT77_C0005G0037 [Candidatus Daviesbacteria bacterium GW2011_GWC2_40_12]
MPDLITDDPISHSSELFSLVVNHEEMNTKITMELFASIVNTKHIPATCQLLQKHLPTIMHSKCFNKKNYPFAKEVKETEIGHLFEHILLEYLCHLKQRRGISKHVHNGLTRWNWKEDARGVFHIHVDAGHEDKEIFQVALKHSIELLTDILQTAGPSAFPYGLKQPLID